MVEENPVTMQQVTTKDPKKVEVGKRLAEYDCRKREELKSKVEPKLDSGQYYGIGAILAVGVIGGLGYYLYQAKKEEINAIPNSPPQQPSHPRAPHPQNNKFEME